jgi:hypothetical protein
MEKINAYRIFVEKPLGSPRMRMEDNIKVDVGGKR